MQNDKSYDKHTPYSDGDGTRTGLVRVISHLLIGLSVHYYYYYYYLSTLTYYMVQRA